MARKHHRPSAPERTLERIIEKTDRSAGPTACHPWLGIVSHHGTPTLPIVTADGRKSAISARKYWWERSYGPVPADRNVKVTCGNTQCINERHMTLVPRKDPVTRFWAKVRKTESCWIWTGYRNDRGYGQFMHTWKTVVQAHRYSFELANGAIPEGLFVCHHCDTPACVRPDHLFAGTAQENMDDMWRKGRAASQRNPAAVRDLAKGRAGRRLLLSVEQHIDVRLKRASGYSVREIAEDYMMTESTIWKASTRPLASLPPNSQEPKDEG